MEVVIRLDPTNVLRCTWKPHWNGYERGPKRAPKRGRRIDSLDTELHLLEFTEAGRAQKGLCEHHSLRDQELSSGIRDAA